MSSSPTVLAERLRSHGRRLHLNLAAYFPSLLLAGYGLFILSLYFRHVMTLYINPTYVWPTAAAGVALCGLAVITAVRRSSDVHVHDDACDCDSCECEAPSPRIWPYLVLTVPLFLAAAFPPRALQMVSAVQRGPQVAGLTQVHTTFAVKRVGLSVDTSTFSLQDWVGALSSDPNPKDYAGKPVKISGQVLKSSGVAPSGYFMVIRYFVTCCIADARPVGLVVKDTSGGSIQDGQWVIVTGKMGVATNSGDKIAVVDPAQITPTKAGNPYIY